MLSDQEQSIFLAESDYIDCRHPLIQQCAALLAAECQDQAMLAKRCFEFVRDEIRHSMDYQQNPVTCKASDVLIHATGYCYAKSHLLAALLRANKIPAGLCYQRLSISGEGSPFCLHGLNALYLPAYGWYRVDARGNKSGVNAQFSPPFEQLAYAVIDEQEKDFAEIRAEPLSVVIDVLTRLPSVERVSEQLPDACMLTEFPGYRIDF